MKMWQRVYLFVGSLFSLLGFFEGIGEAQYEGFGAFLSFWIGYSLPLIIYGLGHLFFIKMK